MKEAGYPDAIAHKAEHNAFIENLTRLHSEITAQPEARHLLAIRTRKLLSEWFFSHVSKVDKKLGDFLLSKTKAACTGT